MLDVHREFYGYKTIGIYQSQKQIDDLNAQLPVAYIVRALLLDPVIESLRISMEMVR
jgi:hypothetical protein